MRDASLNGLFAFLALSSLQCGAPPSPSATQSEVPPAQTASVVAAGAPITTITITAPRAGASVSGAVALSATVTNAPSGSPWLRLCYDNNPSGLATPPPCQYGAWNWINDTAGSASWNTAAGVSNGAHVLQVDGWVTSGSTSTFLGSATESLTVANTNAVVVDGPSPGTTLSNVAWISGSVVTSQSGSPWLRACYDNNPQRQSPAPACQWGATNRIADFVSIAAWSTASGTNGAVPNGAHLLQIDGYVTEGANTTRVAWATEGVTVSNSGSPPGATAEILFNSHEQTLGPYTFAFDDNLYELNLLNTPSLTPAYKALGATEVRLPLAFDPPANSDPKTGIVDCNSTGQSPSPCTDTGDAFVKAYRAAGLEPVVMVPLYSYYDPSPVTGCGASDPFCLDHVPAKGWNVANFASAAAVEQSAALAANMVHWFKQHGTPVARYVIGNEEDLGGAWPSYPKPPSPNVPSFTTLMRADQASSYFVEMYASMQQAALSTANGETAQHLLPSGKPLAIGGPALCCGTGSGVDAWLTQWMLGAGGQVDFIDDHLYGSNQLSQTAQALLSHTVNYETYVRQLRLDLGTLPARSDGVTAATLPIDIGEWAQDANTLEDALDSSGTHSADLYFWPFEVVYGASTIGHILKGGGNARYFAAMDGLDSLFGNPIDTSNRNFCTRDSNDDCLACSSSYLCIAPSSGGLNAPYYCPNTTSLCQSMGQLETYFGVAQGTPMPIYHAYGAFTGESVFPHFGQYLATTSIIGTGAANVEVYASDDPRNVVVINLSPGATERIDLTFPATAKPTPKVYALYAGVLSPPSLITPAPAVSGSISAGWNLSLQLAPYSVATVSLGP